MAEKTGLIMRGCGKMADRQILSQPLFDSALLLDPPDTWEVAEENFGNDLFFLYKCVFPKTGVRGKVSVIPQHKIAALRDFIMQLFRRLHRFLDVGLLQGGIGAV